MKRIAQQAISLVAIAAATAVASAPAHAASADEFTIQGGGTVSPGLGVVPAGQQAFHFGGTATVIGTHGTATTYGCSLNADDVDATFAEGAGTLWGGCGPITLPLCVFVRVGPNAISFACAGTGSRVAGGGEFVLSYDQVPMAILTSYHSDGELVLAGA